jgi:hypothetical protein
MVFQFFIQTRYMLFHKPYLTLILKISIEFEYLLLWLDAISYWLISWLLKLFPFYKELKSIFSLSAADYWLYSIGTIIKIVFHYVTLNESELFSITRN